MPRTEGVSSTKADCLILRNPSPATQALWFLSRPLTLYVSVTFNVFSAIVIYPRICSTERPRLSAIDSGDRMSCSPLKVALMTFTGFVDP